MYRGVGCNQLLRSIAAVRGHNMGGRSRVKMGRIILFAPNVRFEQKGSRHFFADGRIGKSVKPRPIYIGTSLKRLRLHLLNTS